MSLPEFKIVDRIFAAGQSAGGHLVALLATNESYLAAEGQAVARIRGVIPISGVYTVAPGWAPRILEPTTAAAQSASLVLHVKGDEPPFLILFAQYDFGGCEQMSNAFCSRLLEKHVPAEVRQIDNRNHISIMTRLMIADADPVALQMRSFIARHMAP